MIIDYVDGFIQNLKSSKNASDLTLVSYRTDLKQFFTFLTLENQIDARSISNEHINYKSVKKYLDGIQRDGFSRATMARKLATLRSFVRFLCCQNVMPGNPIASVEVPKSDKAVSTIDLENIEVILSAPNEAKAAGMRDKTILELLYYTRLRISEVVSIDLDDIDLKKRLVRVRGKGDREKHFSMGKQVQASVGKYLEHARPALASDASKNEGALFVSKNGVRLTVRAVRGIINKYIDRIAAERKTSSQALRFSVASQFILGGADIKTVQEMFGLARVSVSHLYMQIDKERLTQQHEEIFNRRL